MANTITFKKGAIGSMPTSGLTLGEPLYVTDDQTFHVATSATEQIMVGAKVESAAQLAGGAMTTSDKKLASQGAIKAYVESFAGQGLDVKDSVMAASTSNDLVGTPTLAYSNTSTATADVNNASPSSSTTVIMDNAVRTIELGDVLTYGGYSGGATVAQIISATEIVLSAALNIPDNTGLTFTKPAGVGATLTASGNGAFTCDLVAMDTVGERFLLKDQTAAEENGIYTLTVASGAGAIMILTRATDCNIQTATASHQGIVRPGMFVFCEQGTINSDIGYVMNSDDTSLVIGTDDITWTQFSGTGQITVSGGLSKSVNDLSVADNGVTLAKMAGLASGKLILGSSGGDPAAVTLSGDVTVGNTGVMAIADNAVVLADMEHGTEGDIFYYAGSGAPTRLGKGTNGQVLQSTASTIEWGAAASGDITAVLGGTNINVSGGGSGDATVNLDTSITLAGGALTLGASTVVGTITNAVATGTDTTGTALTLTSGTATGTGVGGAIVFKTGGAATGSSSSSATTAVTALTLAAAGGATLLNTLTMNGVLSGASIDGGSF